MSLRFKNIVLNGFIYLTTCLFCVSTPSIANDAPNIPFFRVGIEDGDYFPYFKTSDNNFEGVARDLLDKIASDLGVQFVYQPMPARRLAPALTTGAVDFIFPDNSHRYTARKQFVSVDYSSPLFVLQLGTYVLSPMLRFENQLVIGTSEGVDSEPFACLVNLGEIQILRSNDLTGLVKRALTGSIDGIYIDEFHLQYLLHNIHADTTLVLDDTFPVTPEYFSLSGIRSADIMPQINDWIDQHANEISRLLESPMAITD